MHNAEHHYNSDNTQLAFAERDEQRRVKFFMFSGFLFHYM